MITLDTRLDRQWLRETALKAENLAPGVKLPLWRFAIIHGNEDCPSRLELFTAESPRFDDLPAIVLTLESDGLYHSKP